MGRADNKVFVSVDEIAFVLCVGSPEDEDGTAVFGINYLYDSVGEFFPALFLM